MKKEHECIHFGFYQRNFFCDICRLVEPNVYISCLEETKEGVENGCITQEQIKEL